MTVKESFGLSVIAGVARVLPWLLKLAVASVAISNVAAASETPPLNRPSELTPLVSHAVMEAVTAVGRRAIAVGERGIILISDDNGVHWRQAVTPVSVTLTAVQFVDKKNGWAVGHDGVVLATDDGGLHWARQLDGNQAARLALTEAQSSADASAIANALRLEKEGADKPFLSLSFTDRLHGTVVGAYGIAVRTEDGGHTWTSWTSRVGNPKAFHLYAVRQVGSNVWIAGEQGFASRSKDGGASFENVATPYKGSYFAAAAAPDGTVVLAGLRGNAFRTTDSGASFEQVKLDGPVSVTAVEYTKDNGWLIGNQAGQIFVSGDGAKSFHALDRRSKVSINGLSWTADASVVAAGFGGVDFIDVSKKLTQAADLAGGKE